MEGRRESTRHAPRGRDGEAKVAVAIPEWCQEILKKRAFVHLATAMADGSPQVSPVWCDFDGAYVIVNSAVGRLKDRNIRRRPEVALSCIDPDNPYTRFEIRGRVVEITEEGADEHIDKLAKKYLGLDVYPFKNLGVDKFPYRKPERRVIYKIEPLRVSGLVAEGDVAKPS
ncbi:MAG: PPOX class F420-dependent oxidoreductase [Candidatus Tectomicrobia bacterium]|nr:PPOX class F420-dependent oxidoreductase [Candidatus Tectomicrobia bacterium]